MSINPQFLTGTAFNPGEPFTDMGELIAYGLQTVLLGMGVVFSVLIILWAILGIFKLVFAGTNKKEEKKPEEAAPAPAPIPTEEPEFTPVYSEPDDTELVAVITAAIAAMMDQPATSFRVVSFRRTAKK